jgi:hypothetical protein
VPNTLQLIQDSTQNSNPTSASGTVDDGSRKKKKRKRDRTDDEGRKKKKVRLPIDSNNLEKEKTS